MKQREWFSIDWRLWIFLIIFLINLGRLGIAKQEKQTINLKQVNQNQVIDPEEADAYKNELKKLTK